MRLLAVLVVSLLVVAGCAGNADPAPGPAPNPAFGEVDAPLELSAVDLDYGATHTWPNGDTVTITAPVPLDAEPTSDRYVRVVKVEVTVTNAGAEPKQANSYVLRAIADDSPIDGIATADLIYASGFVAPGASQTFEQGYQIPSPGPVELELQVFGELFDPERPVVFFRGPA